MVSTKPQKSATYWHDDQIAVIYHSTHKISEPKENIIQSLNLENLNSFIGGNGFSLAPFTWHDVPRPSSQQNIVTLEAGQHVSDLSNRNPLESPVGKYLFLDPSSEGTLVVSFFHIIESPDKTGSIFAAPAIPNKASHVANLVNAKLHRDAMKEAQVIPASEAQVTIRDDTSGTQLIAVMPHFWCASTNTKDITNGCPISPPFPVPAENNHTSGKWHFRLQPEGPDSLSDIPASIKAATGEGIFVFVLDTLPAPEQISQAADNCGESNVLLRDIAQNVRWNYRVLSDSLDDPHADAPMTGWDINGERVNFPMADHGVFIAGIVRDLAPDSRVECIRVLNDYGVGNIAMLIDALSHIQNRLLPVNPETGEPGDLYEKPVVVNLSLTATPAEESLNELGYTDVTLAPARLALLKPMQALATQGVVFAASAGNGSGPNNQYTEPKEKRVNSRFPAAFAYDLPGIASHESLSTMIPVGALNSKGDAASYSNYPGMLGIGTYGGELPQRDPAPANDKTGTQPQPPFDASRGVYTATYYPALSETDPLSTYSPAPAFYPVYRPALLNTWAYWSGTSFATPIISALAARIMQVSDFKGKSVRETLLNLTKDEVKWTNLLSSVKHIPATSNVADTGGVPGPRIKVDQVWKTFP